MKSIAALHAILAALLAVGACNSPVQEGTNTNWFTCKTDLDCAKLGPDITCHRGYCRYADGTAVGKFDGTGGGTGGIRGTGGTGGGGGMGGTAGMGGAAGTGSCSYGGAVARSCDMTFTNYMGPGPTVSVSVDVGTAGSSGPEFSAEACRNKTCWTLASSQIFTDTSSLVVPVAGQRADLFEFHKVANILWARWHWTLMDKGLEDGDVYTLRVTALSGELIASTRRVATYGTFSYSWQLDPPACTIATVDCLASTLHDGGTGAAPPPVDAGTGAGGK